MNSKAQTDLTSAYQEWLNGVLEYAPQLLAEKYSNPYYVGIPADWFASEKRIMVVGEEGFGDKGWKNLEDGVIGPDEIERIQRLTFDYLKNQIRSSAYVASPFWQWSREISKTGSVCWSNIDKIHRLRKNRCALSNKNRKELHNEAIPPILRKEIEILNPTHVVFLGWHWESLAHELPDLYKELKAADGAGKQSPVSISCDGRVYHFCYHPSWIHFKGSKFKREYLDKLLQELREIGKEA